MMEAVFRQPQEIEHDRIMQSEKRILTGNTVLLLVFLWLVLSPLFLFYRIAAQKPVTDPEAELMAGFTETRESVIKELYGDRKGYADRNTFHKEVDFLDKEKTRETGEITYDTEAFQAYYDSFLAEYDAMIDEEKVTAVLEEHRESYRQEQLALQKEKKAAGRFSLLKAAIPFTLCLLFDGFLFVKTIRRYLCIRNRDYQLTEGRIQEKYAGDYRNMVRRRAVVSWTGGTEKIVMPLPQAPFIAEGQKVYLIRMGSAGFFGRIKYGVCPEAGSSR